MNNLERLQNWYVAQCDGDWEHGNGIAISTLDNPGWSVKINLEETSLEGRAFAPVKVERTENDWIHASSTGTAFRIFCGPRTWMKR
jgi:hypothetical protein